MTSCALGDPMENEKLPERVGDLLGLILPICWRGQWLTVDEMMELTRFHPATIRWCLRQLDTGKEGGFVVRKRKRQPEYKGQWEFYVKRKPAQLRFPFSESENRAGE
jgi:hypothetical protein